MGTDYSRLLGTQLKDNVLAAATIILTLSQYK